MRVVIYSLLLTVLLSVLSYIFATATIKQDIANELEASLTSIDDRIESTLNLVVSLPKHEGCESEHRRFYNRKAYIEEEVRALGYVKNHATRWYACSLFGEVSSNKSYWAGNTSEQGVFIGWSLLTTYFPEPSFVVAQQVGDTEYFAYVNPRRMLGHWLESPLRDYFYQVYLLGESLPRYSSEHVNIDNSFWSTFVLSHRVVSPQYPYELKVSVSRSAVLLRTATYTLRMLLAFGVIWWIFIVVRRALRPVVLHRTSYEHYTNDD